MDPVYLFLFTLSSLLLFSLFFNWYKYKTSNLNSPPGSHGFPFIGETTAFFDNPVKFIKERIDKYDSHVFKTSLLNHPITIFCGPGENKFVFSNENKLLVAWYPNAAKTLFRHSILFLTGDKAMQTRRLLMKFMRPDRLNRYVGIMDAIAKRNIRAHWEGKGEVKASQLVRSYNFCLSCRIMIGIEDPDRMMKLKTEFQVLLKGLLGIPFNFPGTAFYRAVRASKAIRKELKSMMEERRVASSAEMDLLSWLLLTNHEEGEWMQEVEVLDNVLMYLLGGYESATSTITMVMKYLAELPHIYGQVLWEQQAISKSKKDEELLDIEDMKKMTYTWNVVQEVLRLNPPAVGSPKVAITDFMYEGYHVQKGSKLLWSPHSTHTNSEWFPEPEKFDPSRFEGQGPTPYTFTPFGGGPRICPGKEFAKFQMLVFLHNVVKRFQWEIISSDEKTVLEPIPVATQGLPLRLQPHQS